MSKHLIYIENPDVTTHAAKILLRNIYREDNIKYWLEVRRNYLNKFEKLTCVYCGKTDLKLDGNKYPLKQVATIDHVVPLSKGGAMYDESNFVVACYKCNQRKGSNSVENK